MSLNFINGCTLSEIESLCMTNADVNQNVAFKLFQNDDFEYSILDSHESSVIVSFHSADGEYHKIGDYDYINDYELCESIASERGYVLDFAKMTISTVDSSLSISMADGVKASVCKLFLMEKI